MLVIILVPQDVPNKGSQAMTQSVKSRKEDQRVWQEVLSVVCSALSWCRHWLVGTMGRGALGKDAARQCKVSRSPKLRCVLKIQIREETIMFFKKNQLVNNPFCETLAWVVLTAFLFSTSCTTTRVLSSGTIEK